MNVNPMDAQEDFMEISKDIEQAWRIVTRPQNYSRYRVKKAENLLYDTKLKILSSIDMEATDEEMQICEDLMLGFYHYDGTLVIPDSPEDVKLN